MQVKILKNAFDGLKRNPLRTLWRNLTIHWPANIRRIWSFSKFAWNDWDWDSRPGIYKVLKLKLQTMPYQLENGMSLYGEKYARHIRKVCLVLDRLIADEYEDEEFDKVDEKWGPLKLDFVECEDYSDAFDLLSSRPKAITDEDKKEEKVDFFAAAVEATRRRDRDLDFVFSIIRKYHLCWWD